MSPGLGIHSNNLYNIVFCIRNTSNGQQLTPSRLTVMRRVMQDNKFKYI